MPEPIKTGITQKSQTSKNIFQVDSFVHDIIAGMARPSTLNKKGYNHFKSALFRFNIKAITKETTGIII
jgi:hypothetical protein